LGTGSGKTATLTPNQQHTASLIQLQSTDKQAKTMTTIKWSLNHQNEALADGPSSEGTHSVRQKRERTGAVQLEIVLCRLSTRTFFLKIILLLKGY
jgi:hypothetical protein